MPERGKSKRIPASMELQNFIELHPDQLDAKINGWMSSNPFLELEEEHIGASEEDEREDGDEEETVLWNEDFDIPDDEYETGAETIEAENWEYVDRSTAHQRTLIDFMQGCTPEEMRDIGGIFKEEGENSLRCTRLPPGLQHELYDLQFLAPIYSPPPNKPTFEVELIDGRVRANLIPTLADKLRCHKPSGNHSESTANYLREAQNYLSYAAERRKCLESIGKLILEELQADFFRQSDLRSALCHLLPITIKELEEMGIYAPRVGGKPINIGKEFWSHMGDLLVVCHLGLFKVEVFWQARPALLKMWVMFAKEAELRTPSEQIPWIDNNLKMIRSAYEPTDGRLRFMDSLLSFSEIDIKNANTAIRKRIKVILQ